MWASSFKTSAIIAAVALCLLTLVHGYAPKKPTPPLQVQYTTETWDLSISNKRVQTSTHYVDRINHNIRADYYDEKLKLRYQTYELYSIGKEYRIEYGGSPVCKFDKLKEWADPFSELTIMAYNGKLTIPNDGRTCDAWLLNMDRPPLYLNITSCWTDNEFVARIVSPDIGDVTYSVVKSWLPLDADAFASPPKPCGNVSWIH